MGEENEWLITYSKKQLKEKPYDFLIYGHRHLPMVIDIENSKHVNLGDWIDYFTYGEFDGEQFTLYRYLTKEAIDFRHLVKKSK